MSKFVIIDLTIEVVILLLVMTDYDIVRWSELVKYADNDKFVKKGVQRTSNWVDGVSFSGQGGDSGHGSGFKNVVIQKCNQNYKVK